MSHWIVHVECHSLERQDVDVNSSGTSFQMEMGGSERDLLDQIEIMLVGARLTQDEPAYFRVRPNMLLPNGELVQWRFVFVRRVELQGIRTGWVEFDDNNRPILKWLLSEP